MTTISNWLQLTRLDTNATYATSSAGEIVSAALKRVNDQCEAITLEIDILSSLATNIINATRGPSLTGAIIPLLGEYSMDGGATIDLRFVLVSAQRSMDPSRPILTIDQSDMSILYSVNGTDRVTFVGANASGATLLRANDILNGPAGSIPRPPGAIGGRTGRSAWPTVKGLYRTIPGNANWAGKGRLQLTPSIATPLSTLPLSMDINAATITASTQAAATKLAGTWLPSDSAVPAGARGHYQPHTGDRHTVGAKTIAIGYVGATPVGAISGDGQGTWNEATTMRFTGTGLALDQILADMYDETSMIGGISNHGLANGTGTSGEAATTITDVVVVNQPATGTSTRWQDNLALVATSAGLYYHIVGSGFFVPMSPSIKINAMAADASLGVVYLATDSGPFACSMLPPPYPGGSNPLVRIGGIAFAVADIWVDSSHTVFIRVGGSQKYNGASVDGVYCSPPLGGDTSGTNQGYANWSRIAHSSAILAAGGNINDLYYVDANKADTVYHTQPGSAAAPVARPVAAGQSIIGIDTVLAAIPGGGVGGQFIFVRTDAGNAGLYSCALGTDHLLSANDGTLRSDDGATVQIRKIKPCGVTMQGEYLFCFACTDAGLFRTNTPGGNSWSAPNAVSGLGDFDISFAAAGTDQTVLGESVSRIFAGSARSFLVSCDAGDSWRDVLADKLDGGPAWYVRAIAWNGGQWPDNSIDTLGIVAGTSSATAMNAGSILDDATGVNATGLRPPSGTQSGNLPPGYYRGRRLDEQKQFTFRMVNDLSVAPQSGIQWDELSDLQANANVGVVTASEQIELVEWRFLSAASIARWQLPLSGSGTQTNGIWRDIAPGDMLTFQYNPTNWTSVFAVNLNVYVLSHTITIRGGLARWTCTIANSLETTNLNPQALAASAMDRLTKKIRWGSA